MLPRDAGMNAFLPAGVTTDQRGQARIRNGVVDMGAYESQSRPVRIVANPIAPGNQAILVEGKPGADAIVIKIGGLPKIAALGINKRVSITVNGIPSLALTTNGRDLFIAGGGGRDRVVLRGPLAGTTRLHSLDGPIQVTRIGRFGTVHYRLGKAPGSALIRRALAGG